MQPYDPHAYPSYGWQPAPVPGPPPPRPPLPARTESSAARGLLVGMAVVLVALLALSGLVTLTGHGFGTVDGLGTIRRAGNAPTSPDPGNAGVPRGTGSAPAKLQIGVVTIVSTLRYQRAQSAGTGMVLSADGQILTNNHVIRGATSIEVTVESTGRAYAADLVGTAPDSDVAVLKLRDASGLRIAKFAGSAAGVRVGDAVTGVGNAGGTGRLTAARGAVTSLHESITASDETGQASERLTGLIQIDARIISGDSGGPLYKGGEIVGMDTAASSARSKRHTAYAIPIEDAMAIHTKIRSGVETASIHLGYPGFLGVSTKNRDGRGAYVADLLPGGPAGAAGIGAGSLITGIDGLVVRSADQLRSILTLKDPGTKVKISWLGQDNAAHTATVTLAVGPAD